MEPSNYEGFFTKKNRSFRVNQGILMVMCVKKQYQLSADYLKKN